MINYSGAKPPKDLYERCRKAFGNGVDWDRGVIFTYGDTAYSKFPIDDEFATHEEVHTKQQMEAGIDFWWDMYLTDKEFRKRQEIEAYRAQIDFMKDKLNRKGRQNQMAYILDSLELLYGDIGSRDELEKLLLR